MEIVTIDAVRNELLRNMQRNMLIPLIGAGFSRNCSARNGKVPSGVDYKEFMINSIVEHKGLTQPEADTLKNYNFSKVSSIYHKSVSLDEQKAYFNNNFTRVRLGQGQRNFLSLKWPYIYTLNIDDGIEKNSEFSHVVYSNRKVDESIFNHEKCVIKLHGDVADMLTYADSESEIFSEEQYLMSLQDNKFLLGKFKHDYAHQNLIFIGCSLDSEVDLLYSILNTAKTKSLTSKYVCVNHVPNKLEEMNYEKYGVTHCIVFASFEEMYEEIYKVGIESTQISKDDLDDYCRFSVAKMSSNFNENKPYLFFGKSLFSNIHEIKLPYFFITREATNRIINNLECYPIQFLVGSGCSGKSYVLADIASRIKNRDVYLFQSKDRLSDSAFNKLTNQSNCLIICDELSLSEKQIEHIISNRIDLIKREISVIIAVSKNNRFINSYLKLYEIQGKLCSTDYPKIMIDNTLTSFETESINPLLTAIDAGVFEKKRTITDNIINISKNILETSKFDKIDVNFDSVRAIASLIALAIERKVYSFRAISLDLDSSLSLQCRKAAPLIEYESTWSFETDAGDNSPIKYVVNAEYWLCNKLEEYANKNNITQIVEAYKYIISRIIEIDGAPDVSRGYANSPYREYILFDNINRVFSLNARNSRGLSIIREIYAGLNDLLSSDPNYMHQRSKCYIKSAYYESDRIVRNKYLDEAYRDAGVAYQIFSYRYNECSNDKLLISLHHVLYTRALILCHKSVANSFRDIEQNSEAINVLHKAMISPYNTYAYAKADTFNYNDAIRSTITTVASDNSLIRKTELPLVEELISIIRDTETDSSRRFR